MKNHILLPDTLTVINPSVFFNESVEVLREYQDGPEQIYELTGNRSIGYDGNVNKLWTMVEDGSIRTVIEVYNVPQQIADNIPLLWSDDMCFWVDESDNLYAAPFDAADDYEPIPIKTTAKATKEIYDLLKSLMPA